MAFQNQDSLDPCLQQVLEKYKNVFQTELPAELPSEQEFNHKIDTENARLVNQSMYPLSQTHLDEQQH